MPLFCETMNFLFMSFLLIVPAFLYVQDVHKWHLPLPLPLAFCLLSSLAIFCLKNRPKRIYMVDFARFKPDSASICTKQRFIEGFGGFSEENMEFLKKVMDNSGLGEKTYIAESLLQVPPNLCLEEARKETETVIYGAIDALLAKTGVNVKDIRILVVNCTVLNPTPSISAMVVNHYKMSEDIVSYNLSGMGCSAGLVSIDLAERLLQLKPNSYALAVSTENTISGFYSGKNRLMLFVNCFFRMGGTAILLSNHSSDRCCSKYQLIHSLRTHLGADDNSYSCIFQKEDEVRKIGIGLSRFMLVVPREALHAHLKTLGQLVLPISEKLKLLSNLVGRKVFKMSITSYVPNFKLAFKHFCVHPGGKPILDNMQKGLGLEDWDMEPSRMTLCRFGNTSSSSVWYELAYCEAQGRIKNNDQTWQVAVGSGFKCNSVVWRALKCIDPTKEKNPWTDEIHHFPASVA